MLYADSVQVGWLRENTISGFYSVRIFKKECLVEREYYRKGIVFRLRIEREYHRWIIYRWLKENNTGG